MINGHHAFASLRVSVLLFILLFAAFVVTNAFYTHSAFWWNFSSPVYYLPRLAMGRKGKQGGYMYYGQRRKKLLFAIQGLDEVASKASWFVLCSEWIEA
jgi:hypothetical protein